MNLRKVLFLEKRAAKVFDLFAVLFDFFFREEYRHELVAAFADLRPHGLERDFVPEMRKGLLPGSGMEIDGIHQRSVDVEDDRLYQFAFLCRGRWPDDLNARGWRRFIEHGAMWNAWDHPEVKPGTSGQSGRLFSPVHRPCTAESGVRAPTTPGPFVNLKTPKRMGRRRRWARCRSRPFGEPTIRNPGPWMEGHRLSNIQQYLRRPHSGECSGGYVLCSSGRIPIDSNPRFHIRLLLGTPGQSPIR